MDELSEQEAPLSPSKAGRTSGSPGSAAQLVALIRAHVAGDDDHFYSIALQIAADSARKGHHRVAEDIRAMVEDGRGRGRGQRRSSAAAMRPEIESLFLTKDPRFGLDRMVLREDLKAGLMKVLRERAARDRLAAFGLAPRSRFLLCGPSGVGKTMTAEAFAYETGLPLRIVRLDALITKYMGETGAKIRLVFDAIRDYPGIYFFDEFDALATARDAENDVGEARRILNVLLVAMEGNIGKSLVFAATNLREILDRAIFRRFDGLFSYDNPTPAMARPLIEKQLSGSFSDAMAKIDWARVAARVDGLSHDNLANAALDAARTAVLDADGDITTELLISAIAERAGGQSVPDDAG
jgi:SpoVK/Ycf46/Vps4 family AAA+-type ATPase